MDFLLGGENKFLDLKRNCVVRASYVFCPWVFFQKEAHSWSPTRLVPVGGKSVRPSLPTWIPLVVLHGGLQIPLGSSLACYLSRDVYPKLQPHTQKILADPSKQLILDFHAFTSSCLSLGYLLSLVNICPTLNSFSKGLPWETALCPSSPS